MVVIQPLELSANLYRKQSNRVAHKAPTANIKVTATLRHFFI